MIIIIFIVMIDTDSNNIYIALFYNNLIISIIIYGKLNINYSINIDNNNINELLDIILN